MPSPSSRVPTIRTAYVFHDAAGAELARLLRFDPTGPRAAEGRRGFKWEHRGGPRNGWTAGKPAGTPVPLYRLPAVAAAVAAGRRVWVCVGPRNADDLATVLPAGEVATTAPDGARGAWALAYTASLTGAPVTVIADRDTAGYGYAAKVAAELGGAGCVVRVVRTPLTADRADASDHLAAGLGVESFEAVPAELLLASVPNLDAERAARRGQHSAGPPPPAGDDGRGRGGGGQAVRLLELSLELFDPIWTTTGECHQVPRQGPRITRPLRGGARSFSAELVAEFYDRTGAVAPNSAVTDALKVVQGIAQRSTPVTLANRVARHGEDLVLDLGDDTGRAVVVTAQGWEVVDESPVLFARTARTGALPVPERGVAGLDELWRVVHVRPRDRGLAEAELVHRYFAGVSHPLPLFTGEAGSGKTSAAETLTALIDPSDAMKVSLPGDPKDWAVQIGQAYSLVLDNVSSLQQWQSDALCMAVTGGFTQYRALYTDGGLARFGGQQCIALTAVDLGSQRSDLTTRLLPIELERFGAHERMSEREWAQARDESRPRVLGVLLDRAAAVLAALPRVDALELDLPRLSDFARTCKALDLIDADRGVNADRYGEYLRLVGQQAGDIADEDEVAAAVVDLVMARDAAGNGAWKGTTKELHTELGRASLSRSRYWPETAIALGKRLSSVVGPLREAGVTVDRSERTAGRRIVALYRTPTPSPDVDEDQAVNDHTPRPAPPDPEVPASTPVTECATCTTVGPWCGPGGVAANGEALPCVLCAGPTLVRSACGAPRHGQCRPDPDAGPPAPGDDPLPPATAPAPEMTGASPRPPAGAAVRRSTNAAARRDAQSAVTDEFRAALAEGRPLMFLSALETTFEPRRRVEGRMSRPFWRPELPGCTYAVHAVEAWGWQCPRPYDGPVVVLDRNAAFLSAAASVLVGHGALEHTGALEEFDDRRPGYYQVQVHPWYESDALPHPLLHTEKRPSAWVTAPTVALLRDLEREGRWPDVTIMDSYTADGVRIDKWAQFVNTIRAEALTIYGKESEQYSTVKDRYSMAFQLMLGRAEDGGRRRWECKAQRPDWTQTVRAQAAATMWRWADDCRKVAPDAPPIALRNTDELVIPAEALGIVTTTLRPGGLAPLAIDPEQIKLGTFKVKPLDTEKGGE